MGGVSAMGAVCFTHPLDLVKVHLQTQKDVPKLGMTQLGRCVLLHDGPIGLWNGLTASLFRQATYSTARFAIYGLIQSSIACDVSSLTIGQKIWISAFAGCIGGFIATPGGKINVRMQDDMRLKPEKRRNYKHVFDGLVRVYQEEGIRRGLFSGISMTMSRGTVVTVGQVGFYDIAKTFFILPLTGTDDLKTHLMSSCLAGTLAAILSQPLDVMKTRVLNAPAGQNGVSFIFLNTLKTSGPLAFYRGLLPAWIRMLPQTVLTFVFFEQLRINFGKIKPPCPS